MEGERIVKLRENFNMSRGELADTLDISADLLGKIERGDQFASRPIIIRISDLFSSTLDHILTGREDTSKGLATSQSFVGINADVGNELLKNIIFASSGIIKDALNLDSQIESGIVEKHQKRLFDNHPTAPIPIRRQPQEGPY